MVRMIIPCDPMHLEIILVTCNIEGQNTHSRIVSAACKSNYHGSDHQCFHFSVSNVQYCAATGKQYGLRITDPKGAQRTDARLQGKMVISLLKSQTLRASLIPEKRAETGDEALERVCLALQLHLIRCLARYASAPVIRVDQLDDWLEIGRMLIRLVAVTSAHFTDSLVYYCQMLPQQFLRFKEQFRCGLDLDGHPIMFSAGILSCQGGEHMNYLAQQLIPITTHLREGYLELYAEALTILQIAGEQMLDGSVPIDTFKSHSKHRFDKAADSGLCVCGAVLGDGPEAFDFDVSFPAAPGDEPPRPVPEPEYCNFGSCAACREKAAMWATGCQMGGATGFLKRALRNQQVKSRRVVRQHQRQAEEDERLLRLATNEAAEAEAKAEAEAPVIEAGGGMGDAAGLGLLEDAVAEEDVRDDSPMAELLDDFM